MAARVEHHKLHPACSACFNELTHSKIAGKKNHYGVSEYCCFCGMVTKSGLYVKKFSSEVKHCKCNKMI